MTKTEENIQDYLTKIGISLSNTDIEHLTYVAQCNSPEDQILWGIRRYLANTHTQLAEDEEKRLFAGVLSFIWVNLWEQPYEPLFMYPTVEKHWWEFWR